MVPNGILGINPPGLWVPVFSDGLVFQHLWLKKLHLVYYVILLLCILTVVAVHRLSLLPHRQGLGGDTRG